MNTLQNFVKLRAKALGLNMSQLSTAAGISRASLYSIIEAKDQNITLKMLILLARALQVQPNQLTSLFLLNESRSNLTKQSDPFNLETEDSSSFVRDINYFDGELVQSEEIFTKTWEIQNSGTVDWKDRFLACQDEFITVLDIHGRVTSIGQGLKPHQPKVPIPHTKAGEIVQISATFTAPRHPGCYISYWKSIFANGSECFNRGLGIWVKVHVVNPLSLSSNKPKTEKSASMPTSANILLN